MEKDMSCADIVKMLKFTPIILAMLVKLRWLVNGLKSP